LNEKEVIALFTAIMVLISIPTYLSYINNTRKYAEEQNITEFAEETTDVIKGEVTGKIIAVIFAVIVGIIFALIGLLKKSGLI